MATFSLEGAASGAATGSAFGVPGAIGGGVVGGFFGGKKKKKSSFDPTPFPFHESAIQGFLPFELRKAITGPILRSGIEGIGDLISNPGGLAPNVLDAIRQRLGVESENIAGTFRGIRSNQAGSAARSNLPFGIKNAVSSALDVAEARAQRGARRGALQDSDQLRRQDLSQTFAILDAINQFIGTRVGSATSERIAGQQIDQQNEASQLAFLGSLISSGAESFGNRQGN